mgnify:CR=1 FL=1
MNDIDPIDWEVIEEEYIQSHNSCKDFDNID